MIIRYFPKIILVIFTDVLFFFESGVPIANVMEWFLQATPLLSLLLITCRSCSVLGRPP